MCLIHVWASQCANLDFLMKSRGIAKSIAWRITLANLSTETSAVLLLYTASHRKNNEHRL